MKVREVKRIVNGYATEDGAGVKMIRVLGRDDVREIDPFLMLDAFGSNDPDDYVKGFPMHPHRGIETITYLLEGRVDHKDSLGNGGTLLAGDLQWMTAGRGILHEEMPKETETKGMHGIQFWLNMPQKDKMALPHYFPITSEMIKTIDIETGTVRLISGEYMDSRGVESLYAQITILDIHIKQNAAYEFPVAGEQNSFVYVIDGSGYFGNDRTIVKNHSAAIFSTGDVVCVQAMDLGIRFLLLAGKPLNEPIAWGGPIVMNTHEELRQAFNELREGTFIK